MEQAECYKITKSYSDDSFNLLVKVGQAVENQTLLTYKNKTNLLIKKLIYDGTIKKRDFYFYNEDGVQIQTIEDDGNHEDINNLRGVTERHITLIKSKDCLPGIGLPEVIEERFFDLVNNKEIVNKSKHNGFDEQGNLVRTDTYDSNGSHVYSETIKYNSKGLLTSTTNFLGQETFYDYDDCGNQISIFVPHQNKLIQKTFNINSLTKYLEIIDGEKNLIEEYIQGQKTCSIDQHENVTSYSYDEFGRLIQILFPKVHDEHENIIRPAISYTYDIFNNISSITDPNGYVTYKSYNLRSDPTRISYPDGSFELFKYDLGGSLHRSVSRDRIITIFEYDYLGRTIRTQSQESGEKGPSTEIMTVERKYNAFRCTEVSDSWLINKYKFDPVGRPIVITTTPQKEESGSRCMELFYDSLGRISGKKIWFGYEPNEYSLESYEYDIAGCLLEKKLEDSSGNLLMFQQFVRDINNKYSEEYGLYDGKKTLLSRSFFDSKGELCSYIDALNNKTKITTNYNFYNILGQKVLKKTITNNSGIRTEIEFDAIGRVINISKIDPQENVLSSQSLLYDAGGNKCREINDQIYQGEVIGSQIRSWIYGPGNCLEKQVEDFGSSNERQIHYHYNSSGQMIAKTLPGYSEPLTYKYNPSRLIESIKYTNENQKPEYPVNYSYTYDSRGNIIKAYSPSSRHFSNVDVRRVYDAFGQLILETVADGCGKNQYSLSYQYDRIGRIKSVILPDGSSIKYSYNAAFGTEVKRCSAEGKELFAHKYKLYNTSGKILSETMCDKDTIEHCYEMNGKKKEQNTPFFIENSSYDSMGRFLKIEKKDSDGTLQSVFEYNALSQLSSEKGVYNNSFLYDSLDNIKQINDEVVEYKNNQIISCSNIIYKHDVQGNLILKTANSQETHYKNNILCQLQSVSNSDKSTICFGYDPLGRRLIKKHSDGPGHWAKKLSLQRYIYIGDQEIGSLDEEGKIQELRILGIDSEGLDKSVAIEIKGKIYATIHDLIGNVSALINPDSRKIVESYSYSAFGKEICVYDDLGRQIAESAVKNPWQYAEKRLDKETGFIFFGFRYYNPQIGRWVNPDPFESFDGPNLYAYVHNNPLNFIDKFGLATESNSTFEHYFYGNEEHFISCSGTGNNRYCIGHIFTRKEKINSYLGMIHCSGFENIFNPQSKAFDLGLPDLPDIGIGYINGMQNDYSDTENAIKYISDLTNDINIQGINVHAINNATHGFCIDLFESFMGFNYITTDPVQLLHEQWNNFFLNSSSDAYFLQICHSQGAIHVRNALIDYPPELRDRIFIVAIAPAGYIYNETCNQVVHYRASPLRDLVPYLDYQGAIMSWASGTTQTLNSKPGTPWHDHNFQSATYHQELKKRISNYIRSNGKTI